MGNWTSKFVNGNPAAFATPFIPATSNIVSEDERQKWKLYDYVIVGGGTFYDYVARIVIQTGTFQALLFASSQHDCQRTPTPLSC